MKKLLLALLMAAFVASGCVASIDESGPDEVMLHYDSGPFTAEEFKDCIDPSTRNIANTFDKHYTYPFGQRTWDFTGKVDDEGRLISESNPITVTDAEGVELSVPGIVTFTLNSDLDDDCNKLRQFHERIGNKYRKAGGDWWLNSLEAYMGNPLEKAVDQGTKPFTWRELLFDDEKRRDWEITVGRLAREYAFNQAGDDYFCSQTYVGVGECGDFALTLREPVLPPGVQAALNETAAERELENTANAARDRIDVEAETLKSLVNVLGPDAAVLYQAIKSGDVSVVPIPYGSQVIVDGSGAPVLPPAEDADE